MESFLTVGCFLCFIFEADNFIKLNQDTEAFWVLWALKMKELASFILIFTFSSALTSQTLNETKLISFYEMTFEHYVSSFLDNGEIGHFYIKSDSNQLTLKTKFERFELHFVTEQQALELIKKNKIEDLFWTKEKIIDINTVDILIGGWCVEYKRSIFKNGEYYYAAWCKGTGLRS